MMSFRQLVIAFIKWWDEWKNPHQYLSEEAMTRLYQEESLTDSLPESAHGPTVKPDWKVIRGGKQREASRDTGAYRRPIDESGQASR